MRMMNPSVVVSPSDKVPEKGSRLDLVVLELAAAGIVFRRLPQGFWDIWVFIELRVSGEDTHGPHYPLGRARGLWRALVPCGPCGPPLLHFLGSQVVFWEEKNLQKISLHFDSV